MIETGVILSGSTKGSQYVVICPSCNVRAELHLFPQNIFVCPKCQASIGAHTDTLAPMGYPADKETRKLRYEAHNMLNNTSKVLDMSKEESYKWLSRKLNVPFDDCHFGMMSIDNLHKAIHLMERATKAAKN